MQIWMAALIALGGIGALIFLLWLLCRIGYKKQVYEVLFYLVNEAERQFGAGTGELKFSAVTTWLYEKVPFVKFIFTKKAIDALIERAVERMQAYLKENAEKADAVS